MLFFPEGTKCRLINVTVDVKMDAAKHRVIREENLWESLIDLILGCRLISLVIIDKKVKHYLVSMLVSSEKKQLPENLKYAETVLNHN